MNEFLDILTEKGIHYELTHNKPGEITVRCTSGLHEDSNPSLGINLNKEVFNCFACGYSGSLNKFLKDIGVNLAYSIGQETKQTVKLEKLKIKLSDLYKPKNINLPEDVQPYTVDFKNISAQTMKQFGAFTSEFYAFSNYICIPVYQNKRLQFIEGRHINDKPEEEPKYLRNPAGARVSNILFPFDSISDFSTVILVEGIFDAIKMHDLGYTNTLCIFGTNNFGKEKVKLLDDYGCKHIIIMMDGDAPGRNAAKKISALIDSYNIRTSVIELADRLDPGELSKEYADYYLKGLLNE